MENDLRLQKALLQSLENHERMSLQTLAEASDTNKETIKNAVTELEDRDLIKIEFEGEEEILTAELPIPISELAFRDELTPTQSIIRYLFEEREYGQSKIARLLNYTPGNIQTNLDRIEEKLGRELRQ